MVVYAPHLFDIGYFDGTGCVQHPFARESSGARPQLCGEPGEYWISIGYNISPLTFAAPAQESTFSTVLRVPSVAALTLPTLAVRARGT